MTNSEKLPQDTPIKEEDKTSSLISQATAAAERLEAGNKQLLELIERQEKLQIEKMLGGTAQASAKEETAEEKEIKSAKKLLEGTGYEDMI